MRLKSNRGFTLIELMITVAILGILSSIAYPSYQNYIRKSYRSDAYNGLTNLADRQEVYYLQNRGYASTMAILGESTTTREGLYTLAVAATTAISYTLTATAKAGTPVAADSEGGTSCTVLTYTSAQVMTPKVCWNR